jgi:VCBS repeat protein
MSVRKRKLIVAIALTVAAGGFSSRVPTTAEARTFTPYVSNSPPQRASGDFDGDGRPDLARIQDRDGRPHIAVLLSGSSTDVRLDASVAALIDGDVDHDGDLDLVAATAAGDVLIWLNDGHGRFTRQEQSPRRGFSSEPAVLHVDWNATTAVGVAAPLVAPPNSAETPVVVAQIRPPNAPLDFNLSFLNPQTLRAPPSPSVQLL